MSQERVRIHTYFNQENKMIRAPQDYNAALTRLAVRGRDTMTKIGKATSPVAGLFNDLVLLNSNARLALPTAIRNLGNGRKILSRFWNFYFTGATLAGDSVEAIIYDVAFQARSASGDVWRADEYADVGFYQPNSSEGDKLTEVASGAMVTFRYLTETPTAEERDRFKDVIGEYRAVDVTNFRDKIKGMISALPVSNAYTEEDVLLWKLSSYLALTLMRAATKDERQLGNAFTKKLYRNNMVAIVGWKAQYPFSPPCKECVSKCVTGLVKGLQLTSKAFTKLAAKFTEIQHPDAIDAASTGLLSVTVLTHTARNGLGLIQMLEVTSQVTGFGWIELMTMTYLNVTADAWGAITGFFETQLRVDDPQHGYNWARVINDGYLKGLSPKEHLFIASIFGAVIAKEQGPGVWDAEWAKGAQGYEAARAIGEAVFNRSRPSLHSLVGGTEAMALVEEAKAATQQQEHQNGFADRARNTDW